MFHKILVPLDGSSFGEHALPVALQLVRRAGVPLHVVHVYNPMGDFPAPDFGAPLDLDGQIRAAEYRHLTRKVRSLAGLTAQAVTCAMPEGAVAEGLAQETRTAGADLIVMTTHGRGAFTRFWLGSVADQLIRQTSAPVLLVRPHEQPPQLAEAPELRHILIALDGEPLAAEVIEPALSLGSHFDARYTLLRVLRPVADFNASYPEAAAGLDLLEQLRALDQKLEAEAESNLEHIAKGLRARGQSVVTAVTRHAQPAAGILDYAKSHAVDAIALATHGRHGLPRLFLGSVADKVLRGANVPVLIHRPEPKPNPSACVNRAVESEVIPSAEFQPGCLHGR